jgi:3-hydroxyacyl-[acyl-carrier-protein] dehydratase
MNGLYEIIPGATYGTFEVRLNPAHAIFSGHFPDNPVLPGVCSMMITRECASRIAGQSLEYAAVKEARFLAVVTPDTVLTVNLKLSKDNDGYPLDATICSGETTMFKLKACLRLNE